MFKVKMYVLQPPVLIDMLFCKLLGYLSRGRERFVITAQQSVKSLLVSGSCEIKKKKAQSYGNVKWEKGQIIFFFHFDQ